MNAGFATEAIARERAKKDMPNKSVAIIESQGQFYVEPEGDALIRNWEREVYSGLGRGAVPKKGYTTCKKCGAFINYDKGFTCQRCGADPGIAPPGVPL